MNFEFATAQRILFGAGRLREVRSVITATGRRALVVLGASSAAWQRAQPLLAQLGEFSMFTVSGEPTLATVRAGVAFARQERCEAVIGFGGGSVLDTAKAVAVLLTNLGDPLDYVEVIGAGRALTQPAAPCVAIPTTAGTGAEVTRNAVLSSPEHKVKVSLRSILLLPRVALVDPQVMAAPIGSRLDALTQLIEAFVSTKANPLTDALCREGLRRWRDGGIENWALAALFSGLALANAGLGAVHGLAGPLGGMFNAPHGALCAALLPAVWAVNESRAPNRERFAEVRDLVGDVAAICRESGLPGLRAYGVTEADFPAIIAKAQASSSMKSNPVALTAEELRDILARAM